MSSRHPKQQPRTLPARRRASIGLFSFAQSKKEGIDMTLEKTTKTVNTSDIWTSRSSIWVSRALLSERWLALICAEPFFTDANKVFSQRSSTVRKALPLLSQLPDAGRSLLLYTAEQNLRRKCRVPIEIPVSSV
ncbi:hypothetical protein NW752_002496 [Fusarium irregulare]|uniref:Uncharacterized protein n=1 Tax=Fusarium irregulare TaxID=2494466 RepID=A0A9W8PDK8_9HYPO|nr:hypothetical protein NW766_012808 [Fusarium irregulare]KAJ4025036.1 hypothetical protein NW752_002496 [Fusarium irregulare]